MKIYLLGIYAIVQTIVFISCNQTSHKLPTEFRTEKFNAFLEKANNKNFSSPERSKYLLQAYHFTDQSIDDSLNVSHFAQIARAAIKEEDTSMFYIANKKAVELSKKMNSPYLMADAKWNLAEYHLARNNYDSAYIQYKQAHALFQQVPHPYYSAKMRYNMGYIKSLITDYTGAEILLFQALETFQEMGKEKQIFQVYNLLGSIYDDLEEYDRALEYYQKTLEYGSKIKESITRKEDILNNIGLVYQKMGQQTAAIATFDNALENRILRRQKPELYARLLDNRAYSVLLDNPNEDILEDIKTALQIRDSLNNTTGIIMSHLHLSKYYLQKEQFLKAHIYADSAYFQSAQKELNRDKLSALKLIAKIDTLNAAKYLMEYITLSDSLNKKEKRQRDKFARIHFETDQYIKANEKLFREKVLLMATVIAISLLLILIFIIMNQRSRNKQLKFETQQQKADKEIYSLRIDQMRQSEKARQEERERIAEDLHDSILGQLYGIRLNWEFVDIIDDSGITVTKQQQLDNLLQVEKEIRDISHNLINSPQYDSAHLIENIRSLVGEKSKLGKFKYQFKVSDTIAWENYSEFTKANLYRIIEESLHNIVRHAAATKVKLTIVESTEELQITLTDNGRGFNESTIKKGIGLKNMESRTKKIRAVLTISSNKGGTTIILKLKKKGHGRANI